MPSLVSGGTFTNNWKNILDKLRSILRAEFKGALPIHIGEEGSEGTQFLIITPIGSSSVSFGSSSEEREYTVQLIYYFDGHNTNKTALDHVLRYTSRIEALVHDNMIMTLSDSTKALNCHIENTEFDLSAEDGTYSVSMQWMCSHVGNLG